MILIVGLIKTTLKNIHKYVILNTQLAKNMTLQLFTTLRIRRNMSFSNTQLTKKHDITIVFKIS